MSYSFLDSFNTPDNTAPLGLFAFSLILSCHPFQHSCNFGWTFVIFFWIYLVAQKLFTSWYPKSKILYTLTSPRLFHLLPSKQRCFGFHGFSRHGVQPICHGWHVWFQILEFYRRSVWPALFLPLPFILSHQDVDARPLLNRISLIFNLLFSCMYLVILEETMFWFSYGPSRYDIRGLLLVISQDIEGCLAKNFVFSIVHNNDNQTARCSPS